MHHGKGSVFTNTLAAFVVGTFIHAPVRAQSQEQAFVAPPRTISDITAILDQQKPDPQAVAKTKAAAEAAPPAGASKGNLAHFLYNRCQARAGRGDAAGAVADCEKALELARASLPTHDQTRLRQGLALQYGAIGDPKRALAVLLEAVRTTDVKGAKGFLSVSYTHLTLPTNREV